jgi:hypothetical protein
MRPVRDIYAESWNKAGIRRLLASRKIVVPFDSMPGLEPRIRLPDVALRDLRLLALHAQALGPLIEAFPDIAAAPDVAAASRAMLERTKLAPLDLADLLQGVEAILDFRERQALPPEEAYRLLTEGILGSATDDWKNEHLARWMAAEKQLVQLLDPDNPIAIMTKSRELLYSHERVFLSGAIYADVRPTFDSSGTKVLRAVVNHTLSIRYRGQRGEDQFTVALDGSDLDAIEELVKRAKQKAAAIREQLTCWPVTVIPRANV